MRRLRPRIASALIAVAALGSLLSCLAACGALTADFDGFTNGGDETDAASDNATPPNPGSDANNGGGDDATTIVDGGSDAADAYDGNPCVVPGMTTRICDGFERSAGIITATASPENWTNTSNVTLANDTSGTGKVSAFVAGSDSGNTDSFLSFQAGDVRRVTLRARVRIVTSPPEPGRQIVVVKWIGNTKTAQIVLYAQDNGLVLNEQVISGSGANHTVTPATLTAGFHRIALDVDLVQDKVTFSIDGAPALPMGETFPTLSTFPPSAPVTVSIGARYSSGTPLTETEFDDVLIATATQ